MSSPEKEKIAVLLFGFLRTAEITAGSLLNNIVIPNNADIFYYGPDASDNPGQIHQGILDKSGFIKINPKNIDSAISGGIEDRLRNLYGDHLKAFELHNTQASDFDHYFSSITKNDWLFDLNPNRFMSMFNNMQGVFRLMKATEEKEGIRYDKVIITRPDLSFYNDISADFVQDGLFNIPRGIGFCPHTGNKRNGVSTALFYLNKSTGEYIPYAQFNDQLFSFSRNDAETFENLVEDCAGYISRKVPLTPETILYFHLCVKNKLKVKYIKSWVYEIVRSDDRIITNINDLMLLDVIDRYHPYVRARAKKRPIWYFLKYSKIRFSDLKKRFFG